VYEHMTFDKIMQRMLDRIPNDVDKREGSIIYNALSPAAVELSQLYKEIDINWEQSYADKATGIPLERRTAEQGVNKKEASSAKRKGLFYGRDGQLVDIPLDARFSLEDLNYRAVERISVGQYVLECETLGIVGNSQFGDLIPIDYIDGLTRAVLADVLVPGEDRESDESLRKKYFDSLNEKPFGGNIADYKKKLNDIPGVGGAKVIPTWKGGGTVKGVLIGSDFNPPASELVNDVQTAIDPVENSGLGIGLAPIGHRVTITGASDVTVNVETTLTLDTNTTPEQIQPEIEEAIGDYLLALRKTWKDEEQLIVRLSQIEARFLTVPGVLDVSGTKINGVESNLVVGKEQVPVQGGVVIVAT